MIDGVEGGSKIARLFKDKDERLFSSVKCSEDEHNLLATNINLEAESCSNAEICEGNECTHCHVISSSEVMSAIGKLKTDNISDYGLVYSNKFTLGTELLFQYLSILYTSMIYCGFCPASFICLYIFLINSKNCIVRELIAHFLTTESSVFAENCGYLMYNYDISVFAWYGSLYDVMNCITNIKNLSDEHASNIASIKELCKIRD